MMDEDDIAPSRYLDWRMAKRLKRIDEICVSRQARDSATQTPTARTYRCHGCDGMGCEDCQDSGFTFEPSRLEEY